MNTPTATTCYLEHRLSVTCTAAVTFSCPAAFPVMYLASIHTAQQLVEQLLAEHSWTGKPTALRCSPADLCNVPKLLDVIRYKLKALDVHILAVSYVGLGSSSHTGLMVEQRFPYSFITAATKQSLSCHVPLQNSKWAPHAVQHEIHHVKTWSVCPVQ